VFLAAIMTVHYISVSKANFLLEIGGGYQTASSIEACAGISISRPGNFPFEFRRRTAIGEIPSHIPAKVVRSLPKDFRPTKTAFLSGHGYHPHGASLVLTILISSIFRQTI
jgi:hypothetical protein